MRNSLLGVLTRTGTSDTRTGQLCGKLITMLGCGDCPLTCPKWPIPWWLTHRCSLLSHTITLFDVYIGHLYAQCWDPGWGMTFIGGGTKLASYHDNHLIRKSTIKWTSHLSTRMLFMDMSLSCNTWTMDGSWVRIMSCCFGSHSSTGKIYACLT